MNAAPESPQAGDYITPGVSQSPEQGPRTLTTAEAEALVSKLLGESQIAYSVAYVGQTKDASGWEHDLWRVTLDERQPDYHGTHLTAKALQTEYRTGLGLRKKRNIFPKRSAAYSAFEQRQNLLNATPQKPTAASVLHSLLLDAEAGNESFANWCANFGYNADSIKALNIYQACERIGQQLNKLLPRELQSKLREALQDY